MLLIPDALLWGLWGYVLIHIFQLNYKWIYRTQIQRIKLFIVLLIRTTCGCELWLIARIHYFELESSMDGSTYITYVEWESLLISLVIRVMGLHPFKWAFPIRNVISAQCDIHSNKFNKNLHEVQISMTWRDVTCCGDAVVIQDQDYGVE